MHQFYSFCYCASNKHTLVCLPAGVGLMRCQRVKGAHETALLEITLMNATCVLICAFQWST